MRLLCAAQTYHNAAFAGPPPKQPPPRANDHAGISPARCHSVNGEIEIKAVMFNRSNSKRIIRPVELCRLRGIKGAVIIGIIEQDEFAGFLGV